LIFFYIFAGFTVLGSAGVVLFRNPLSSALSLVGSLFGVACLFALAGAHFLAAMQVLIYAGAVMVLVVFVIMMLHLGKGDLSRLSMSFSQAVGILVGGCLGILLVLRLGFLSEPFSPPSEGGYGGVREIGRLLFTDYLIPFEATSVLLTVAIVGAVVLARKGT